MGQVGGEPVTFGLTPLWQTGRRTPGSGDLDRPEVGRAAPFSAHQNRQYRTVGMGIFRKEEVAI
jgi:hypothetical protein